MWFRKRIRKTIDPEQIFMDAANVSALDRGRLEGRLELPITKRRIVGVGVFFSCVAVLFLGKLFSLQIVSGEEYAARSINNHLDRTVIFAERAVIYDRTGEKLAWNAEGKEGEDFAERVYTDRTGLGQILGYVNYPRKDKAGFYFRTDYTGRGGVEEAFDTMLRGRNGEQLLEVDAMGNRISEHVIHAPQPGEAVTLTLDANLTSALYEHIATSAAKVGFRSGAGIIMDVKTGEILALASYPAFDPEVMTRGLKEEIDAYNADDRLPFLNKIISGIYTPGSIVKPFVALFALEAGIIHPSTEILSTRSLVVPNPYNPSAPSVFTDWRAHGLVDMRHAISVSSNVYFYYVGGGFKEQRGIGISKLYQGMKRFGFEDLSGIALPGEARGVVPNPEWKQKTFDDEWRLGDTYNTAIGQFGFQVTPLSMVRAYAALANGGKLLTPIIRKGEVGTEIDLGIHPQHLSVIKEGMRLSATEGTARALLRPHLTFGAKTGTAELGSKKEFVNSWIVGFYPYEEPRYAFVLLMERGPQKNLFGAPPIFSQFIPWMMEHTPQYIDTLKSE